MNRMAQQPSGFGRPKVNGTGLREHRSAVSGPATFQTPLEQARTDDSVLPAVWQSISARLPANFSVWSHSVSILVELTEEACSVCRVDRLPVARLKALGIRRAWRSGAEPTDRLNETRGYACGFSGRGVVSDIPGEFSDWSNGFHMFRSWSARIVCVPMFLVLI